MQQGKQKPKYAAGTKVLVNGEELIISTQEPKWNGHTFMYSFEGKDMRCGEMYLREIKSSVKK